MAEDFDVEALLEEPFKPKVSYVFVLLIYKIISLFLSIYN